MRVLPARFCQRRRFIATCFLGALLAALLPKTASAGDREDSIGKLAGSRGLSPSSFPRPVDRSSDTPRWTISIEAIVLERRGGVSQTLVERVPGTVPFLTTFTTPGTEAFNSSGFRQGFSAGPKLGLMYRGDSGYAVELSYFNIFTQGATKTIGPNNPADWLVMRAPGIFWQTQDFADQGMTWSSATNLYSTEFNGRWDLSSRVTVLAGIRWLQLNDKLVGTLSPADLTAPTWKQHCPLCDIFHITPDGPAGDYPPFWATSTTNNLYGFQLGVDGKILELGRFALDGRLKIGLFDNNATQFTGVSLQKVVYPVSAVTNHLALAGEASLQLKYQLSKKLKLKVGYEALWLDGVALAPGQIQEAYTTQAGVRALGVNSTSSVLFQGATFGLEYSF